MAPESTAAFDGRICICVATHRRPVGLVRLLASLETLDLRELGHVEIVVADNDAGESARSIVEDAQARGRLPVHYVCEPTRGIARIRNTLVRTARERGASHIAFIDDDEVATVSWLRELVRVMRAYDADVVTGPVLPRFEPETSVPRWMLDGGFFDLPRFATGTPRDSAYTSNTLVRVAILDRLEYVFDEQLKLSGGEDVNLFMRVHDVGGRIVWADDAVVHEYVPQSRTRSRWLLRRAFQVGHAWGSFRQPLNESFRRRSMRGLAKGLIQLPWAMSRGRAPTMRSMRLVLVGLGYLAARGNVPFSAYGRTDGR